MRAQANVDMEDAFLLRLDPLQEFLREPLEELAVLDAVPPTRAPTTAVDEQDFDIRRVTEFPAAEFAHPQYGKGTGFITRQAGLAIELLQLDLAIPQAAAHDHFGQFRQGLGEIGEA